MTIYIYNLDVVMRNKSVEITQTLLYIPTVLQQYI